MMVIIQDKKFWMRMFLISLFLLVLSPLATSAPPITSFTSQFEEGLAIDFFAVPSLRVNTGFGLNIHTYNLSDGFVVSSPISSCKAHLFSPNGTEVEVQYAIPVQDHFRFIIDENNITQIGYYAYSLQCNTSRLGGYRSGGFFVNVSGIEPPTDFIKVFFILFFILVLGSVLYTTLLLIRYMEQKDMGLLGLASMFALYFVVLSMKYFNFEYMGSSIIDRFADLFINVGRYTHIILPVIIFIICFMKRRMELKEESV